LKQLYEEIKEIIDISRVCVFIVGNKNDLYVEEKVSKKEVEEFSKSINGIYRYVSALNGDGINELFECVGRTLLTDKNNISISEDSTDDQTKIVELSDNPQKNGNKNNKVNCC